MSASQFLTRRIINLYRDRGEWPSAEEVSHNGEVAEAEALIDALKRAEAVMEEQPLVREDRVERAEDRLEEGEYDQPEVLLRTAEKILSEMKQ